MTKTLIPSGERWLIWTEHKEEGPRTGFGDTTFARTIEHLRKRGDASVRWTKGEESRIRTMKLS